MRYSVEATPDPPAPSVAASVNDGRVVYQPAALAAGMVSVVVGAVVSAGPPPGSHVSSSPSVNQSNVAMRLSAPPAVWFAAASRPILGCVMPVRCVTPWRR